MTTPDISHTLDGQGRDGGDQHAGETVLSGDAPDVQTLMDGLEQDDTDLVEEEQ